MTKDKATQGKQEWEEEFDEFYIEDGFSSNAETVKDYISDLLSKEREKLIKMVEEEKKLHTHDSIPGYTADLDGGCILCIKNQTLDDLLAKLEEKQ